jgi:hypothetical protein
MKALERILLALRAVEGERLTLQKLRHGSE